MDKLKTEIRISTGMYEYINVQFEGTPEEIKSKYQELKDTFKAEASTGLNETDLRLYLCTIIDSDLTNWLDVDSYNMLSDEQKKIAQSLKRFSKRLTSKEK